MVERQPLRRSIVSALAFFLLAASFSPAETPRIVKVFDERQDEMSYNISAHYEPAVHGPVTLTVRVDLINMSSDKPVPLNMVLREAGRFELLHVSRGEPRGRWNFKYDSHWQYGDMHAHHGAQIVYSLPFTRGMRFEVTQGHNGSFSHNGTGAFAVDFAMPVGTPVRAARGGLVAWIRNDVTTTVRRRPPGQNDGIPANEVVILHEDGTVGWYMHFRPGGVEVAIGSYVREGDIIGMSGDTGLSSQPHLHFEVYKPVDGYVRQTIPVRFHVKGQTRPVQLQEGRTYEPR